MNPFDWFFDLINIGVERLFAIDNIALWIAFALLAWCAAIIAHNGRAHHAPFTRQLEARLAATRIVGEADSDAQAQRLFAEQFERIDAAMMAGGRGSTGLRHGWRQFRETILFAEQPPLRATTRPDGYFLHLGDETRVLAWWANIFVAIGLTFTFLGIVAALHKTVTIMASGADQAGMLAALTGLLKITAAKFWTSIGGVGASIILRLFDRRWHSATLRKLDRLCEWLEYGTLYVPAQRLAADQLARLEQLPLQLADAFGSELRPVAQALAGLRDGGPVGSAGVAAPNAGAEMAHLAGALAEITRGLEAVNGRLLSAGGQASEEIAAASQALGDMQGGLRHQVSAIGQALTDSAQAAADRNAQLLERAATALEQATSRAARDMGAAVDHAVSRSAEESARVLSAAFAVFSERFDRGSAGLIETLAATSRDVQGATALLGQAARDAAAAALPIREASETIAKSSERTRDLLQRIDQRSAEQERIMQGISASLSETGDAATRAWTAYRDRFEAIDDSLARALDSIAGASSEHAARLNEHVGRIDTAFAQSIEQLAQAIVPLTGLSRDLDALLQRSRKDR